MNLMHTTELPLNNRLPEPVSDSNPIGSPFIEANTEATTLGEIQQDHIIPVFVKDNEPLISQSEFIEKAIGIAHHVFEGEAILEPNVRISHPVKGRIPSAKGKPASQLEDHEKTLYYERMAFVIEIPSIKQEINGQELTFTIGGVKAYNMDNLNTRKGSPEHFKIFNGFLTKVCTNLCIWTDGFSEAIQVDNARDLEGKLYSFITDFDIDAFQKQLQRLQNYQLTEHQFAQLVGRARLYQYLPATQKKKLPELKLNDTQIATVAKEYYRCENFGRHQDGNISLWEAYNLLTEANKSSYIDTFLDRGVNAFQFTSQIAQSLEEETEFWFLS